MILGAAGWATTFISFSDSFSILKPAGGSPFFNEAKSSCMVLIDDLNIDGGSCGFETGVGGVTGVDFTPGGTGLGCKFGGTKAGCLGGAGGRGGGVGVGCLISPTGKLGGRGLPEVGVFSGLL